MTTRSSVRWRGLKSLVQDAVEHGSRAIERVQMETARKPFAILESIPPLRTPAKVVHLVHDLSVTGVHTVIRAVNATVGTVLDVVIDSVEARAARASEPASHDES